CSLKACGVRPRRARVGDVQKQKTQHVFTCRVFSSGDVLLSHGLSPYYHRGCSVSLPCSEWERVVPLRYCHQSAEPHWHFAAVAATQARGRISGDCDWRVLQTRHSSHVTISKNCDSLRSTYGE